MINDVTVQKMTLFQRSLHTPPDVGLLDLYEFARKNPDGE